MKYASFIEKACERAGVTLDQAEVLNRATLLTLAERVTGGEARNLAARLPKEFRGLLSKNKEDTETYGVNEFTRRVNVRAGVDPDVGERGVRAVLQTLHDAVGGEFDDVMAQLPSGLRSLMPAAAGRR
jgi:uncharacterized protein (DUF2267 family)